MPSRLLPLGVLLVVGTSPLVGTAAAATDRIDWPFEQLSVNVAGRGACIDFPEDGLPLPKPHAKPCWYCDDKVILELCWPIG